MLDWIFRKKKDTVPEPSTRAAATEKVAQVSAPPVDWNAALAQAQGNDEALLALARTAGAPLPVKQAAVEAIDGEAALRLAEREFRRHDRRVHQLAKQRLQAKEAQRQTREQAARLIASARALTEMPEVPVNRIVELDRAWQSLDASVIEAARRDEFEALSARLAAQGRERVDIELQRKRWQADAAETAQHLQAVCVEAASGTQPAGQLVAASRAASDVERRVPADGEANPALVRRLDDLRQAVRIATALAGHLAVLDRLLAPSVASTAGPAERQAADPDAGDLPKTEAGVDAAPAEPAQPASTVDDALAAWQALLPLSDPRLAAILESRFARWQQACDDARQARQSQRREQARERQRALKGQQVMALADCVAQAETALDAGQLSDAHLHLTAIDDQLQGAEAPAALHTRVAAAQARLAQLRGWQHWAGGRAREELVLQAEALAAATVGVDGGAEEAPESDDAVAAEVARLSIRQRADLIQTLRKRWKEIDTSGGAGSRALWQRFDAAVTAAGEPVAAHVAAQRAARETNLAARVQLLEALESVAHPEAAAPAAAEGSESLVDDAATHVATNEPSVETPFETPAGTPLDARRLGTALDRFRAEWRKLGPLEHTVPRAARDALVERLEAALRRVEEPLQSARAGAAAQRQALLERARSLAGDAPGRGRDLVGEVRALQAEWQEQAKALPLARAAEQALWTEFKAAIDAAFAAREAVYRARDAEFEAHAAERVALIERLQLRPEDSPAAQRRLLAEVESVWQRCGPAPRARAAALDAEYRAARDGLRRWLDDSEHRVWQATCDTLDAKLALCLERERRSVDGAEPDAATIEATWSAWPVLPAPLEDALRQRAGLAMAGGSSDTAPDADDLLLQLEIAWELPTPPAFETARRERKLLAMKQSLEGRRSTSPQSLAPGFALARLIGRAGLDGTQADRLAAVLAAFRRQGPQRLS
jgi:hypothetical protein